MVESKGNGKGLVVLLLLLGLGVGAYLFLKKTIVNIITAGGKTLSCSTVTIISSPKYFKSLKVENVDAIKGDVGTLSFDVPAGAKLVLTFIFNGVPDVAGPITIVGPAINSAPPSENIQKGLIDTDKLQFSIEEDGKKVKEINLCGKDILALAVGDSFTI